jgi:hypothetical protein
MDATPATNANAKTHASTAGQPWPVAPTSIVLLGQLCLILISCTIELSNAIMSGAAASRQLRPATATDDHTIPPSSIRPPTNPMHLYTPMHQPITHVPWQKTPHLVTSTIRPSTILSSSVYTCFSGGQHPCDPCLPALGLNFD